MLRNRFASAFDKLHRAREHAETLRTAEVEYVDGEPVTLTHAKEGEEIVHRVDSFRSPPPSLPALREMLFRTPGRRWSTSYVRWRRLPGCV